jgi:hypothetical protein
MTSVPTSDEPERRVAEALRAHASGAGAGRAGLARPTLPAARSGTGVGTALLLTLLGGAVLGVALALISILFPGVLPPLG